MRFRHNKVNFEATMIFTKSNKNVQVIFSINLKTFTCDLKIDVIMFEPNMLILL